MPEPTMMTPLEFIRRRIGEHTQYGNCQQIDQAINLLTNVELLQYLELYEQYRMDWFRQFIAVKTD